MSMLMVHVITTVHGYISLLWAVACGQTEVRGLHDDHTLHNSHRMRYYEELALPLSWAV